MISKNRVFLLKISWLTKEDGQKFYAFPISKNGGCKAGYVRSSIEMLEMKKPETLYLCGFPTIQAESIIIKYRYYEVPFSQIYYLKN